MDVVAVVALIISLISLGWQIVEWRLAGSRAKAELLFGLADDTRVVATQLGRAGRTLDKDALRRQMPQANEVIGIEVTNHGRAAVVVDAIMVKVRGSEVLVSFADVQPTGAPLPHTIEPGANSSWFVLLDQADIAIGASRALGESPTGLYMAARLGTGKVVDTVKALRR